MTAPRSVLLLAPLLVYMAINSPAACLAQQVGGTPSDFGLISVTPRIVVSPDGSELDFFVDVRTIDYSSAQTIYFDTAQGIVDVGGAPFASFADIGGGSGDIATDTVPTANGATYTLLGYGGVCSVPNSYGPGGGPCDPDDPDGECPDPLPPPLEPLITLSGPAQAQCNSYESGATYSTYGPVVVSINTAPPVISPPLSISSDAPGGSNTIVITGTNLVDPLGVSNVNITGSGVSLSNEHRLSTTSVSIDYVIDATAAPGPRDLTVSTTFGTSNPVTFTVTAPPNPPTPPPTPPLACSTSTVPNAVTLQISGVGNGSANQGGSVTVLLPTAAKGDAAITMSYGPSSTASSVASSIASVIARKFLYAGVTAKANGDTVTIQSRTAFGVVSASSTGANITLGSPSNVSCFVNFPNKSCNPLKFNYSVARPYSDGTFTTPRQHIITRHIQGAPSPGITKYYTSPGSVDQKFTRVQDYNLTTAQLGIYIESERAYVYAFPPVTLAGVTFGQIGYDFNGNPLSINNFYIDLNTCLVDTSFPE